MSIVMLMFLSELIDVQTGEFNSLIFKSKKYDMGLKKMVECSQSVAIPQECIQFLASYRSKIGEVVAVGVSSIITKKGKIFYMSQTDILNLDEYL